MKNYFDRFYEAALAYIFRIPKPALKLIGGGVMLLLAASAGFVFQLSGTTKSGPFSIRVDTSSSTPMCVTIILLLMGVVMIGAGIRLAMRQQRHDDAVRSRKRALVIETRGLRDGPGSPLEPSVPANIIGQRESRMLDLRQMYDGEIMFPERGLEKVAMIPSMIEQAAGDMDRRDFSIVYGGLAPVPYTFLAGILIDDEGGSITTMDWDRNALRWRELDEADDGKRFVEEGISDQALGNEVVLAVSVSYQIVQANLDSKFGDLPKVRMMLQDGHPNAHWSEAKQAALADQFFKMLIKLEGLGIKRINLVLAAQASLVFRFGRIYDKKNLPALTVWQFDPKYAPPYPWGIAMPVRGQEKASLERELHSEAA